MTKKRGGNNGSRVYSLTKKGDIVAWSLMTLDERIEARQTRYARLERVRRMYGECGKCGHINERGWRNCASCGWDIQDIPF